MSRTVAYLSAIVVAGLVAATSTAPIRAESIDKLTYLTFSGSVQVPGVKLDAGTYGFRLMDPDTHRNVIQIFSRDGLTMYAMFNTLADSRVAATIDSTVTFREMPVGVPPAIKSLFYGGERRGYEFVYPKGGPIIKTAEVVPQPEITFARTPVVTEFVPEAVPAPTPTPEPVLSEPVAAPPAAPPELPRTAGPVPLVALGGLVSLIVGLGAGLIRRFV